MTRSSTPPADPLARRHLLEDDPAALRRWLQSLDQPAYRAEQVIRWIYERGAATFDEMSNLPKTLRARLADEAAILTSNVAATAVSEDGTHKLLLTWPDGQSTETVWIPADRRQTACLSTQVGCPVGCRFCASGLDGLSRNLTAGEIVEQALRIANLIRHHPDVDEPARRLSNIVIMGMGEPLANYDATIAAVRTLNASWGLGIGARKITISTVGLPKQIRRLAAEDLQLNLALSLHAPTDRLRAELVPWARGVSIAELTRACRDYFERTGREITLEYVLLEDVNMQPEHAEGLARIARRLRANVNLLRYNPVPGLPYRRPGAQRTHAFQSRLRELGVNVHLRSSRGRDVSAACGQLRRAQGAEPPSPAPKGRGD